MLFFFVICTSRVCGQKDRGEKKEWIIMRHVEAEQRVGIGLWATRNIVVNK